MAARHGLTTFDEVAARAATDPEWFWAAAADDVGLRWLKPYDKVLDLSDGPQFPHFFKGGGLNWADYAIDRWIEQGREADEAIVWEGDDGSTRTVTYGELKEQIDLAAGAFVARGVGVGDVVALAADGAGGRRGHAGRGEDRRHRRAVLQRLRADAGARRLLDSKAKLMVTADGFERRGKLVPIKETADEAAADAPDLRTVLVVRRLGRDLTW